ncbi:Uncharacterised protein [uncultured archaeon]|nr:Uncharacterised protein [uncultured archaeon]
MLGFKKAPENPLDESKFQSKGVNKLKLLEVKVEPHLERVKKFSPKEIEAVQAAAKEKNVVFSKLAVNYTTEMPLTKGVLIGYADAWIGFLSADSKAAGNGQLKESLKKISNDFGTLSQSKLNSEFLAYSLENVKASLDSSSFAGGEGSGEAELLAETKKAIKQVDECIDAYEKVISGMGGDKENQKMSIYKKLVADKEFLAVQQFIMHNVRMVANRKEEFAAQISTLESRRKALSDAINKTDIDLEVSSFKKWGKKALGLFGAGTGGLVIFATAKDQIFHYLNSLPATAQTIVAGIGLALGAAVVFATAAPDLTKEFFQDRVLKGYGKKIDRIKKKMNDYIQSNLRVVGYKVIKEAAYTGYLGNLKPEGAPVDIVRAAYEGDFRTIRRWYEAEVARQLESRTIGQAIRKIWSRVAGASNESPELSIEVAAQEEKKP